MVRAVTFDFWNTVMWEERGSLRACRLELWAEALLAAGVTIDLAALEQAHDDAHRRYEESWRAGRQFRVEDAADVILASLSPNLPDSVRNILLDGFSEGGRRAAVEPCDGIEGCLRELGEAGVRLGIICDIGLTPSAVVRELLDRHGLLALFDHTTFSDETGFYKPAPEIFKHALSALGDVPPGDAAHVGDRRRTDVGGALAVGMRAVRYNAIYEDREIEAPEAPLVTGDLSAVPSLLDISRLTA